MSRVTKQTSQINKPRLPRISLRTIIVFAVLMTVSGYLAFLYQQKQSLVALAQDFNTDGGGGGYRYVAKYGEDKSYRCRGTNGTVLTEEYADGRPERPIKDCAEIGQTCYELNNQVKGEYVAACLYNPPTKQPLGGEGCPTQAEIDANKKTTPQTCKKFNPSIDIFDTSQSDIAGTFVSAYFQEALNTASYLGRPGRFQDGSALTQETFRTKADFIVSKSNEAGLNPAIFLGFWRTESAFSIYPTTYDLGCINSRLSGFTNQVICATGLDNGGSVPSLCARSKDAASQPCRLLADIRKNPIYANYQLNLPIRTFDDYMEAYGSHAPDLHPGQVNNNCISTYNKQLEAAVKLGACKGRGGGGNVASKSCPIPQGTVTCGSKQTPVVYNPGLGFSSCGHCGTGYNAGSDQCIRYPEGTSNAIDIAVIPYRGTEEDKINDYAEIRFPTINGHNADWTLVRKEPAQDVGNQQILGYKATDTTTGENFYVQFHHSAPGSGSASGRSGDIAGKVCGSGCNVFHTHVQIQTGSALGQGQWLNAAQFFCRDNTKYTRYADAPST